MKYFNVFAILLFGSVISFTACNSNSDAGKQEVKETPVVTDPPATSTTATPTTATTEPAQNAAGVWHYICSKGCPGGSGTAGNCAVCGGPLAHNSAYHSNANNTPPPTPSATTTPSPTTPKAPEPAQNAAGVWHYTCAKGCPGGSGSAGTCSKCGGPLSHNQAYHQ